MDDHPVFTLRLPLELAPTMNAYSGMTGYQRARIRNKVSQAIIMETMRQRGWDMGVKRRTKGFVRNKRTVISTIVTGGHQRILRITRHSSQEPDEISVDIVGGKIPVDRLRIAGVIRDDDRIWLQREARWEPAPPGKGYVLIEVFDPPASSTQQPAAAPPGSAAAAPEDLPHIPLPH